MFLTVDFQASNPQPPRPKQTPGRDKFAPLDSPLAPFSIPAWSAALQAVDRSRLVEPSKTSAHFGHYAFPDPALFVTPTTSEKKAKFIGTWLRSRDAWIARIAHEGSLAMSGQHWRNFLATDLSSLSGTSDTKTAKRRQEIHDILMPRSSSDPAVKPQSAVGEPLVWQGHNYQPDVLPPENVVRQILWELYELNFTREFLSLDCRACQNLDLTDNEQLLERQSLISKCFAADAFMYISLPNCNSGLAADILQERLPYLQCMVHVMKSWKGTKPTIFYLAHHRPQSIPDQQAKEFEAAVVKYYCQHFFSYFGRAAQIPHRLFPM